MSRHCADQPSRIPAATGALRVALAGNPNAGKTTLFNRLTNLRAKVGNYPGVTVEKVVGQVRTPRGRMVEVIDLPGAYSLTARSPEEQIALDVLAGRVAGVPAPNLVVVVVDASNLERNLYLVEQVRELGVPMAVALNMIDVAEERGHRIAADLMARMLGVPVLPMNARSGRGVDALIALLDEIEAAPPQPLHPPKADPDEITERYRRIEALCAEVVSRPETPVETHSDRLDRVLTHRVLGPAAFLSMMTLVFVSVFWWAGPLMALVEAAVGMVQTGIEALLPEGVVRSLLVEGVIGGVGNVVVFVPQIAILFVFLAVMEDSGYMARAAFIMDRMMRGVGLSGRSFIPLLGSFACAIPGIMATRTIPSPRDRLATILVAPFMSCSARLPVYVLVTSAFFPNPLAAGLVMLSMYLLGIAAAVGTSFLVKRVLFRTAPEPFLMELPPYRLPVLRHVVNTVWLRVKSFLWRAGTVILVISVALWALMNVPLNPEIEAEFAARRAAIEAERGDLAQPPSDVAETDAALSRLSVEQSNAQLRASFAGRLGHLIEPVVEPLGFDWKIGIGLIASFAAREVLVSTMGIVYSIGEDEAADAPQTVSEAMRADRWPDGRPVFTPLVGVSILVFFVLALQCMSTIAVVRRETNSWKWPLIQFAYMTTLAYVASLIVYQGGCLLGLG